MLRSYEKIKLTRIKNYQGWRLGQILQLVKEKIAYILVEVEVHGVVSSFSHRGIEHSECKKSVEA